MAAAACKLWQMVHQRSRAQLEDTCRLQFTTTNSNSTSATANTNSQGANEAPDLCQLWENSREPLNRAWIAFLEAERAGKGSMIGSADISSQIQNRVSRLTGGLSRLASRKIRKVAVVASAAHTLASSGVNAETMTISSMAVNAATATVTQKISQSINSNSSTVTSLSHDEYDMWTQVSSFSAQKHSQMPKSSS